MLRTPDSTACVEVELRALASEQLGLTQRRSFVQAGMDLVFATPSMPPLTRLATSCTTNGTTAALTIRAGQDRVRAALQVFDAGFAEPALGVFLPAEIPNLSGGGSGTVRVQTVPTARICIPAGTSPGSECADSSECCDDAVECAVEGGTPWPICRP